MYVANQFLLKCAKENSLLKAGLFEVHKYTHSTIHVLKKSSIQAFPAIKHEHITLDVL